MALLFNAGSLLYFASCRAQFEFLRKSRYTHYAVPLWMQVFANQFLSFQVMADVCSHGKDSLFGFTPWEWKLVVKYILTIYNFVSHQKGMDMQLVYFT